MDESSCRWRAAGLGMIKTGRCAWYAGMRIVIGSTEIWVRWWDDKDAVPADALLSTVVVWNSMVAPDF